MARPSSYKDEYVEQAFKLCLLGATDKQLADFFGVSEVTLNAWKKEHKEFLKSLKEGKDQADAKVAESLFNRALGYSHPEDKVFCNGGEVTIVPTIKHYPPDPTSAIFWLKNRQKENWRDKHDVEHSGTVNHAYELSREELLNIASSGRAGTASKAGRSAKPDSVH